MARKIFLDDKTLTDLMEHKASGFTYQQIADSMNLAGHKTPNGREWNTASVSQWLIRYGKRKKKKVKRRWFKKPANADEYVAAKAKAVKAVPAVRISVGELKIKPLPEFFEMGRTVLAMNVDDETKRKVIKAMAEAL